MLKPLVNFATMLIGAEGASLLREKRAPEAEINMQSLRELSFLKYLKILTIHLKIFNYGRNRFHLIWKQRGGN